MRPTRYAYGSRAGVLSASFVNYFPISRAHLRRSLLALVAALLLPVALLAQQDSYDGQSAPNQYSPNQQSADPNYRQPGYSNPQPDNQQPDAQQAYPQQPDSAQQGYGQAQPLVAQDLEQLVAPIALYPDTLVAQILTASTYPQQVSDADRWRRSQGYAPPEQIADGANGQLWDPSVKALTAFPQVLAQMVQNLHWTTELGDAYYNQPQDVLQAVQVMRHRAQAAGNLQSSPQESVNYDQGNIVLAPPNPEVIYVPTYNPWAVYGQPVAPYPGFSLLAAVGSFLGSSFGSSFGPGALRFGLGIGTAAFMHTPFGLLAWGLDWLAQSVLFNGSNYWSHSASVHDWGFPRGGPRAFGRGAVAGGVNRQFGRPGAYGRPGGSYNNSRSESFARTNRNEYAGNRGAGESNRGYAASGGSYGRTSREAYNSFRPAVGRSPEYRSPEYRSQQYGSQRYGSQSYGSQQYRSQESRTQSRPQQYARSDYGSSSFNRSGQSFNSSRGNSGRGFQRSDFGKHSSSGFTGKGFSKSSEKQARSGGFHMFGGGHSSGEHSSKSFGGGKSFSHSHSGGGHSGGHSGGKHHH